jgi:hypothetical protein
MGEFWGWQFSNGDTFGCSPGIFTAQLEPGQEVLQPSMPDYSCTSGTDVKMNGCTLAFEVDQKIVGGKYQGKAVVGNAPGASCTGIVINVPVRACSYTIAPGEAVSGVTVAEDKAKPQSLDIAVKQSFKAKGSKALCLATPSFTGGWKLRAYQKGTKTQVNIFLLSTGGEKFSAFEANKYPHTISGNQDGEKALLLKLSSGRTFKCSSVAFGGTLSGASSTVTTQPSHEGCTSNTTQPANIAVNSCSYVFDVLKNMDMACSEEGDSITLSVYATKAKQEEGIPFCVYSIAPQSDLTGLGYFNSTNYSFVRVSLSLGGIAVTRVSGSALSCGSLSQTALYTGSLTLNEMWVW